MAISCWDSFTANDWDRYSRFFAWFTTVIAVVFAIATWAFPKQWDCSNDASAGVGVWSLVIALFIVFQETPVCNCGVCVNIKVFIDDTLQFKRPAVLGIIYTLASILCLIYPTPVMGTGLLLLMLALLKFFAQCQLSQDAADKSRYQSSSSESRV